METVDKTPEFVFASNFEDIINNIANVKTCITQLNMQLKTLEKDVKKKMKTYEKIASKSKSKVNPNRKPSGFAEPVSVSKELTTFMKLNDGDKVARTEVTKYLSGYIKEHNLKSQENGRVILPNEALEALLCVNKETLTFFNLQRFMNKHFIVSNASTE